MREREEAIAVLENLRLYAESAHHTESEIVFLREVARTLETTLAAACSQGLPGSEAPATRVTITDAMVERAAMAICREHTGIPKIYVSGGCHQDYYRYARAALTAALAGGDA